MAQGTHRQVAPPPERVDCQRNPQLRNRQLHQRAHHARNCGYFCAWGFQNRTRRRHHHVWLRACGGGYFDLGSPRGCRVQSCSARRKTSLGGEGALAEVGGGAFGRELRGDARALLRHARCHKSVDGGARLSLKRCRRIARRFCARCAVCFPRERACSHLLRDVQVRRTSHARLHLRERARRSGRPRHGSPLQACGDLRPGAPERRRPHHGGRAALEHARAAVGGRGRERQCAELAK
mmetsp:Transcript_8369/g.21404  ORF Transcript_8369/g.21404 Transcript_8369/m.21404 type:complete len:237 (+) Transcript_8369:953-1663(+)